MGVCLFHILRNSFDLLREFVLFLLVFCRGQYVDPLSVWCNSY